MLTVNNLSVQFGKRILFDSKYHFSHIIFMELSVMAGNLFLKIISGEMDPTLRTCPFRNQETYVGFKSKPQYV
jgi:hypothetical protein